LKIIDLRSDTVTQPTEAMREAMAKAPVGDDVYEDDPTVIILEKMAADITGFEGALFIPSGTMANQLAVMAHTKRGDEVILGQNSHIVAHEVGGAAILSGVSYRIVNNADHTISGADIDANVRIDDIHYPDTGMVCVENPLSNGNVVSIEKMKDAYNAAKRHNLPVHMDGARLFNAAVYLNVEPVEITQYCDSIMFCLSKGLCAPIGSMLCGDASFIKRVRKLRKLLGGGMRQVGILAAAGIIAIEKMTKRLHEDHKNAQYLYDQLSKLPQITIAPKPPQINMVFFKIETLGFNHEKFAAYLLQKGIKTNFAENNEYRFVTHNDVSPEDLDFVLNEMTSYLA